MLLCSVLFLIAIYVLFLLFLVRFTSKSRILRVNKESDMYIDFYNYITLKNLIHKQHVRYILKISETI